MDRSTIELDRGEARDQTPETTLPPPRKGNIFPTWGDLLAILGLFFLSQLITRASLSLMGIEMPSPVEGAEVTAQMRRASQFEMGRVLFWWSLVSQSLLIVMVLIYRALRGGRGWSVRSSMRGFDPTIILWGFIMILSVVVVIEPLMELIPPSALPQGRGLYMLGAILLVAPIFEELLCRGIILEAVRAKYGAWIACIVSALVFGLMHIEPQSIINAFFVALILGYLYVRTNSIICPIILHAINNMFAYLLLILGLGDATLVGLIENKTLYNVIYGIAIATLIVSIIYIMRYINRVERVEDNKKIETNVNECDVK